jgi:hypothetical protein
MVDEKGEGGQGSRYSSTLTAHADFGINLAFRVCNRRIPDENRERKTMHAATTRSIITAAGLAAIAAGAALALAPLAAADDLTSTVDSEISSLNALFTSEADLAGDGSAVIQPTATNPFDTSRWRTHHKRPRSRPSTTSCTG